MTDAKNQDAMSEVLSTFSFNEPMETSPKPPKATKNELCSRYLSSTENTCAYPNCFKAHEVSDLIIEKCRFGNGCNTRDSYCIKSHPDENDDEARERIAKNRRAHTKKFVNASSHYVPRNPQASKPQYKKKIVPSSNASTTVVFTLRVSPDKVASTFAVLVGLGLTPDVSSS